MKDMIFHTPTSWRWNKFPEPPEVKASIYADELALRKYEKQVTELIASALEIANPELIPDNFLYVQPKMILNGRPFYHWPGEVEINEYCQLCAGAAMCLREDICIAVKKAVLSLPKEKTEPKEQEVKEETIEDIENQFAE